MILFEAKFSSCEPVKPDKLSASKIQRWDRHRRDIPIPEGRNWREETGSWVPRVWNMLPECRKDYQVFSFFLSGEKCEMQ